MSEKLSKQEMAKLYDKIPTRLINVIECPKDENKKERVKVFREAAACLNCPYYIPIYKTKTYCSFRYENK